MVSIKFFKLGMQHVQQIGSESSAKFRFGKSKRVIGAFNLCNMHKPITEHKTNYGRGRTNPNFLWPGWFQVPFVITNHPSIFFFTKNTVWPPLSGVWKNRPPHYMAKNENYPRGLCDSLNEAFWCTNCNAKNLTSLRSLITEKIWKNRPKKQFFQKCPFLRVFLVFFSEMRLCRELRFFVLQSVQSSCIAVLFL